VVPGKPGWGLPPDPVTKSAFGPMCHLNWGFYPLYDASTEMVNDDQSLGGCQ
jgi:hypothetical protein